MLTKETIIKIRENHESFKREEGLVHKIDGWEYDNMIALCDLALEALAAREKPKFDGTIDHVTATAFGVLASHEKNAGCQGVQK